MLEQFGSAAVCGLQVRDTTECNSALRLLRQSAIRKGHSGSDPQSAMSITFAFLAALTLAGAAAALSLRNLVHCALCLVIAFAGLAGIYCLLGAQFVGLAQVLVYVGAVAILIVFAILLTREGGTLSQRPSPRAWFPGVALAVIIFGVLAVALGSSEKLRASTSAAGTATSTVKQIGDRLMTEFVLPLEVMALVLTAATIGAVIIALREEGK